MRITKIILFVISFLMVLSLGNAGANPSACLLPDGVVAWWPGDGNLNHWGWPATPQNGVGYAAGMVGLAFDLDGQSAFLATGLDVQPSALPATTWEVWVYPTRLGFGTRQQILSDDDGGHDRSVLIEADTANFGVFTGSGVWQPTEATANTWQHIAVVFTPTNIVFFKNGVQFSYDQPPEGQNTLNKLNIGRNPGYGEYFQGRIDEVTIYTRALTPAEIQAIYSAGSAGKSKTAFGTADLAVAVTATPQPVQLHQSLRYTITVTNQGPDSAPNVVLADITPGGVNFWSAAASVGSVSQAGGQMTAALGTLTKDQVAVVTIVVIPGADGVLTNQVEAWSLATDPHPSDNTNTLMLRPAAATAASQWVVDYSTYLGGGGMGYTDESGYAITTDPAENIIVGGFTDEPDSFPFTSRFGMADAGDGAFITKTDPTGQHILFSTFLAGGLVRSLATDAQGNVYAAGEGKWFFSTTNAFQAEYSGGFDAFVAKLSPDGSQLLYATYLGGSGHDLAWSLAVDNQGQAYVTGWTDSTNFPVTPNALQPILAGKSDAFLAILNNTGSALVYATYLGGNQEDFASSLALDNAGNIYLGGRTQSDRFMPKVTPQRLGPGGWQNAFVAKLNAGGRSLEYLTLIGGAESQSAVATLTVDASGHVYVFGHTDATNFPVTLNCWQPMNRGLTDNFLAKLNPSGSAFVYATYLGGSGNEVGTGAGLAVDNLGNAYVAAQTGWGDIAPVGIAANIFSGYYDGYAAQIDPTGSTLMHLMYLGGHHWDAAYGLALDKDGRILVTGGVGPSPQPLYFPITSGALQVTNGGGYDAFVTRIREVQGPPPNDAFAKRVRLIGSRVTAFENNSTASKEAGEPEHAGNPGGRSLWWTWQAPATGRLMVTTEGSSFNTLLALYTNNALAQLKVAATNDQLANGESFSHVKFPVTAGTEYQIAVDGHNGESGTIILSLTLSVPPNDDFANRILVTNFPVTLSGSNLDATWEPDDPFGGRSVWWEWMAPINGAVMISTDGSSFDTDLGVFTNSVLSQLGWVAWNDNHTNVWTSQVNIQAVAGTAYQIVISGGYNESMGTIRLKIIPGAPPANDSFTNRIWLTGAITNFITANNYGATREVDELNPGFEKYSPGDHTVWWSWKAPEDGRVTITTEGSDFDTRLAVFTGTALTNLMLVALNDDQGYPHQDYYASRVNFAVQANTIYQMVVDGVVGSPEGTIQLALHFYHPFSITSGILAKLTAEGFQLQGQGYPGATYAVQVSTNLVDWESIPSVTLRGPAFGWRDTNALQFPQRFYRLMESTPGPLQ